MKPFKLRLVTPSSAFCALALIVLSMSARGVGRPADAVDITTPDASRVSSSIAASSFKKGPETAFNDATANYNDNDRVLIENSALDIVYTFDKPSTVGAYGIQNFSKAGYECDKRAPKTWTLSGSNDGSVWVMLDARTSETGWEDGEYRYYEVANTRAYLKYKIDITANNGSRYTQFARMELFGAVGERVVVEGQPIKLGTPTPPYGLVPAGSAEGEIVFSISGDGPYYYSADGRTRGTFAFATYKIGEGEEQTVMDTSFSLEPTAAVAVAWNFGELEYRVNIIGAEGTLISVDGGTPVAAYEGWHREGARLSIKATTNTGNEFLNWGGGVPGGAETTFVVGSTVTLTPTFADYIVNPGEETYPSYASEPSAAQSVETRVKTVSESAETRAGSRGLGLSLQVK